MATVKPALCPAQQQNARNITVTSSTPATPDKANCTAIKIAVNNAVDVINLVDALILECCVNPNI